MAAYFKQQYNITLRSPHLPCVAVGNGRIILPPEVCDVVKGQVRPTLKGRAASAFSRCDGLSQVSPRLKGAA